METSVSVTYVESAAMSQRKKTVIDILRDSHDFVSGEAISDVLGVSRNAVHKHVKSLRKRGYRIVGVSRRGYRLEDEPARLSMGHVTQRTEHTMFGHSFRYHDEIESTNLEAKTLALKGAPEGTVVVAEAQSAGRGRLGRRWTSPAGKGLLFSVDPPPVAADEPGAPAHHRRRRRGCRSRSRSTWPLASRSSGPTTSSSATERSGASSWRWPARRTRSTGWFSAWVSTSTPSSASCRSPCDGRPRPSRWSAASRSTAATCSPRCSSAWRRSTRAALRGGFESALTAFRERDYLLARTISVETRQGPVVGAAAGIDDRGALLVELPHRRVRSFHSGDVTLHT